MYSYLEFKYTHLIVFYSIYLLHLFPHFQVLATASSMENRMYLDKCDNPPGIRLNLKSFKVENISPLMQNLSSMHIQIINELLREIICILHKFTYA